MMAPHWLDALFAQGAGDDKATWKAVVESKRFVLALDKAAVAYREAKMAADDNKAKGLHIYGGSPEQYARVAFLHEINQEPDDRP